ncbi:MAG TPA: MFS transporter [Bacteroidales bacterium]|nr:MFS transporter [Bacteroidales bacterium]
MMKIPVNIPFNPRRSPVFYGWIILFAGIIGVIMSIPGQTMGVSVFTDHLIRDLSMSRVSLSTAYLLGTAASGFIITHAGTLYDRMGARIIAIFAGFFLGVMLIYLTQVDVIASFLVRIFPGFNSGVVIFVLMVLGFFGIRFFGQGVLTMTSRNMVMKWFDQRRGFANSFLGIFTAFGFSYSPRIIQKMIDFSGWRHAWIYMAVISGVVFVIFAFTFFRDNPEDAGLIPDGRQKKITAKKKFKSTPDKDYTLSEAVRTFSFWVFNLTLTMNALYLTAYTFQVESIFAHYGFDAEKAVSIFLPTAFVAVPFTFFSSWASDYMRLKYLLTLNLVGLLLSMAGMITLGSPVGIPLIIAGNGISNGMFGILMAITWPRFFGVKHLGQISGFAMSWTVIGSALGPFLFSVSNRMTNSYNPSVFILAAVTFVLFLLSFRANNISDTRES